MKLNARLVLAQLCVCCALLPAQAWAAKCSMSVYDFTRPNQVMSSTPEMIAQAEGVAMVQDWLKKNQKKGSPCFYYQILEAEVAAADRNWAAMQAALLRAIESNDVPPPLGGFADTKVPDANADNSYDIAQAIDAAMIRAAAPDGDRGKLTEEAPAVPSDYYQWFEPVVQAASKKWPDSQEFTALLARLTKP